MSGQRHEVGEGFLVVGPLLAATVVEAAAQHPRISLVAAVWPKFARLMQFRGPLLRGNP
jgi:hypothetical protein